MKKTIFAVILLAAMLLTACGATHNSSPGTSPTSLLQPAKPAAAAETSSLPQSASMPGSAEPASSDLGQRQRQELLAQQAANPLGDLSGIIIETTAAGFRFSGSKPELVAEGALVTGEAANGQSTNILYSESTVFQLCLYDISENTSEYYSATVQDVSPGALTTLWGEYSGTDFIASLVQVIKQV